MLPIFTNTLKQVLETAQHEARGLNQETVGADHLALALFKQDHTAIARMLRAQHIDREMLISELRQTLAYHEDDPGITGQLPLDKVAQQAMADATRLTKIAHKPKISTCRVLLALLEHPTSGMNLAVRECSINLAEMKNALNCDTGDED